MNTRRLIGAAPWVLATTLLAACGGGEDRPQGTDPFPLSVGDRWDLQVSDTSMSNYTERRRVSGTAVVDGADVTVVQVQPLGGGTLVEEYFQRTGSEVRRLPPSNANDLQLAIGPVVIMKLPLTDGQQWTQYDTMVAGTYDWDGDGIVDPIHEYAQTHVHGPTQVSTPAGTFDNAYEVTTGALETMVGTRNGDTEWTSTVTKDVYVPGIGLVQRYRNVTPQWGPRSYIRNDTLTGYVVAVP